MCVLFLHLLHQLIEKPTASVCVCVFVSEGERTCVREKGDCERQESKEAMGKDC